MKTTNRVRVRKSLAVEKFGRLKTRSRLIVDPTMRKTVVSYNLPIVQVEWIEQQAELAGMHRSTFVAAMIEASMSGMEEVSRAEKLRDEQSEEFEDD